ncbi:MAG: helix-hairpin-helix domain-containing protein [Gemmatimonadetes bacterium]|nr:helix-hairpin-helix domain-containing protein [Gemmatimonadota bacterium]
MTRAEVQAVIFVAVSMLVGAFVLLVKQYDSGFLPDLGPAPAVGRPNAGIRPEPAPASGTDATGAMRSPAAAREIEGQKAAGNVTVPSADPRRLDSVYPAAGSVYPAAGVSSNPASSAGGLQVPVNTAPASELQKLPGIGPKLAAEIIAYRKRSGHFASVEQLLEVKGIGPAKLGRLRPFVELK